MSTSPDFRELFGVAPSVRAFAPGRVNLIGEHTDYQLGFVLPTALVVGTTTELRPLSDDIVRVHSSNQASTGFVSYELHATADVPGWGAYVQAVTRALTASGHLIGGFIARFGSDLPLGEGLSSSAALQVSLLRALRTAYRLRLDDVEVAKVAHLAESKFVGVPVGMMDQIACSLADPEHALFIDTQSLHTERIRVPDPVTVVVVGSGIEHRHSAGGYRARRLEAEAAARLLGVASLRQLTAADAERIEALPEPLRRRARHIVTENGRVLSFRDALASGDVDTLGGLLAASHRSLRDDYEVSLPDIDALVDIAVHTPGVLGARMTGGGFGGAVVVLAESPLATAAAEAIASRYSARTNRCVSALVNRRHDEERSRAAPDAGGQAGSPPQS